MKKTEFNKLIKSMKTRELQDKLQELEKERQKMTTKCSRNFGTSTLTRNYPTTKDPKNRGFGNFSQLNKNIARIKTELNVRLLTGSQSIKKVRK